MLRLHLPVNLFHNYKNYIIITVFRNSKWSYISEYWGLITGFECEIYCYYAIAMVLLPLNIKEIPSLLLSFSAHCNRERYELPTTFCENDY